MLGRIIDLYRKGIAEPQRVLPFLREKITRYSHLLGDGSWAPRPVSIKLYVNAHCNANCRICDIGQNKEKSMFYRQSSKGGENFSVDLLDKLLSDVAGFHPNIDFAGVEPLLHPEIIDLIKHVKRHRLFLSLTTNGIFLERHAERLINSGPDVIVISVNGPEKVHDDLIGISGAFQKTMAGMVELKKFKINRNKNKLRVAVNYCVTDVNAGDLVETASIVLKDGLADSVSIIHPYFVTKAASDEHNKYYNDLAGISTPVGPQENILNGIDVDVLWEQLCELRIMFSHEKIIEIQKFKSKKDLFIYYRRPELSVNARGCRIPWQRSMIMSNGDVVIYNRCIPYIAGNIKRDSFLNIWNGKAYRSFRQSLRQAKAFPICSRCCGVV